MGAGPPKAKYSPCLLILFYPILSRTEFLKKPVGNRANF
jgi:hypothetical protein